MDNRKSIAQVKSGFRLAIAVVASIGIAFLFLAGMDFTFFPTGHSRVLGSMFLITSTAVMVMEMNRWVKLLPGFLAYAVLNGMIIFSTGHALGRPSAPVGRLPALAVTLFFAFSAVLCNRFRKGHLNRVDRLAVLVYVFILAWLMAYGSTVFPRVYLRPLDYLAMGVAIGDLVLAWAYGHLQHQRTRTRRRVHPGAEQLSQE